MKKILLITAFTAVFSFAFFENNYAQDEWAQGRAGIYSVGVGGTQAIAIGGGYGGFVTPAGFSLNFSGEYKVYKFIGFGFETGLNFFFNNYSGYGYYGAGTGAGTYIGIPIGIKCNIHILDAIGGIAIANKLDVFGGLNFGGGPAFGTLRGEPVIGFIEVGPQVGVRYWFGKVAVFGEFGWGATFANVGVSF